MLSENIRKYRLEKGFTQELLSKHLGVSAQLVSKWERGETLPDALMLPELSKLLEVSPNCLFDYEAPDFNSLSRSLKGYINSQPEPSRTDAIFRIMALCKAAIEEKERKYSPTIEDECGFALFSEDREPRLAAVLMRPENGFEELLRPDEEYRRFFEILSRREVLDAVFKLYKLPDSFTFDREYAANELCPVDTDEILSSLKKLRLLSTDTARINSKKVTLWRFHANGGFIALFVLLNQMLFHSEELCERINKRKTPYLL